MGSDFITNRSRISVRMILSALRSSTFSITTFQTWHAMAYIGVVNFCCACANLFWVYILSVVDPVITFLVALLRGANYETTGFSSKKTGGTKSFPEMKGEVGMAS